MTVVSPVISLPNSQSAAALPTSQPIQRQYATLPRKGNTNVMIGGTLGRSPAPLPPRRDPKTALSVGRARARSMVAGLGNFNFLLHFAISLIEKKISMHYFKVTNLRNSIQLFFRGWW